MKMDASGHTRTRRPWPLLACALALILGVSAGCGSNRVIATVQPSKSEAATGEDVPLSVDGLRITDLGGCAHETTRSAFDYPVPVDRYWTVTPAGGARVRSGVFRATKPGTYTVTFADTNTRDVQAATIVVTGDEVTGVPEGANAPVNRSSAPGRGRRATPSSTGRGRAASRSTSGTGRCTRVRCGTRSNSAEARCG